MSTTDVLTAEQIVAAVDQMDEAQLDVLWSAAKARHKALHDQHARQIALSLKPGDRVRIQNIRPKALDGSTGEVVAKSPHGRKPYFDVKLDVSRHPGRDDIPTIPASCLEKIEDES